jgi:cytochrome b561
MDMTKNLESAETTAAETTGASERFDRISIALHWLTVLLVVLQFTSAWLLEAVNAETSLTASILETHRTAGILTWIVGVGRLVWRHRFAYLPAFPHSMPKLQQLIAKANEYALYALLIVQPITGLGRVLLRGQPFDFLIWQIPVLFDHNQEIRSLFVETHELGAKALLALIALHAGAALFHRLILRDEVLQRMLPWTSRSMREANARQAVNPAE